MKSHYPKELTYRCKATKMKSSAETWISTNGPSQDLSITISFCRSNVESQCVDDEAPRVVYSSCQTLTYSNPSNYKASEHNNLIRLLTSIMSNTVERSRGHKQLNKEPLGQHYRRPSRPSLGETGRKINQK